jgi:hypothetical protein
MVQDFGKKGIAYSQLASNLFISAPPDQRSAAFCSQQAKTSDLGQGASGLVLAYLVCSALCPGNTEIRSSREPYHPAQR